MAAIDVDEAAARAECPSMEGHQNIFNTRHSGCDDDNQNADSDTIESDTASESEFRINIDEFDSKSSDASSDQHEHEDGLGLDRAQADVVHHWDIHRGANVAWHRTMHDIQVSQCFHYLTNISLTLLLHLL